MALLLFNDLKGGSVNIFFFGLLLFCVAIVFANFTRLFFSAFKREKGRKKSLTSVKSHFAANVLNTSQRLKGNRQCCGHFFTFFCSKFQYYTFFWCFNIVYVVTYYVISYTRALSLVLIVTARCQFNRHKVISK